MAAARRVETAMMDAGNLLDMNASPISTSSNRVDIHHF